MPRSQKRETDGGRTRSPADAAGVREELSTEIRGGPKPRSESRRPPGQALDPAELGRCAHVLIGELLGHGNRSPAPEDLLAVVARSRLIETGTGPYRQAAKQRLLSMVSIYFRLFVPGPEWGFLGVEVGVGPCRLDLVWRQRSGMIRADELKSGRAATLDAARSLDQQLTRQVEAALSIYGESFVGVRALLLAAPRRSFLMRADGGREQVLGES